MIANELVPDPIEFVGRDSWRDVAAHLSECLSRESPRYVHGRDGVAVFDLDLAALSPLGLADVVGALDMGGSLAALGRSAGAQHGSSGDRTSGMPSVYEPRVALDDPCGSL